jgi:hypothetical protein
LEFSGRIFLKGDNNEELPIHRKSDHIDPEVAGACNKVKDICPSQVKVQFAA